MDTLSDSESDQKQPFKPIFKSKRKVAKGKRRMREAENEEFEESLKDDNTVSSFGSLKVSASTEPASKASRWARYSALAQTSNEEDDKSTISHVFVHEDERNENIALLDNEYDEEHTVVENNLPTLLSENKAYTRLELPKHNTFSLKESHFRDAPPDFVSLEKEYADQFGNLSDDEENRVNFENTRGEDDDLIMDLSESEATRDPPLNKNKRDLAEMYDSEVSIESDDEPSISKLAEIPGPADVLKELSDRFMKLDVEIKVKEKKSAALKESLASLELQRQRIVSEL